MYIQVVTYGLAGITESEYLSVADEVAPRFSAMPGLQAKLWLENPEEGRYGAIYFWDDRESMERFVRSNLFEATNMEFADVTSAGFGILENLTAQTQPGFQIVEEPRPPRGGPATKALTKKAPVRLKSRGGGARRIPVTTKASATKAPAKKAPAKKAVAKKAPATKAVAKKAPAKKAAKKAR